MMNALDVEQARRFAQAWLPAWTGNDPQRLAAFYSEDAFYLDPAVPQGLRGKPALLGYLERLLARNPAWVWTQVEGIPMKDGFLNKWRADIPIDDEMLTVIDVCLVQLDGQGKIRRNEVYFDRSELLARIAAAIEPQNSE